MNMNAINERQIGVTFGFRAKAGYYESEMAKTDSGIGHKVGNARCHSVSGELCGKFSIYGLRTDSD